MSGSAVSSEKILLLGLGELGEAVLAALVSHPHASSSSISILLRRPPSAETSAYLMKNSIHIVHADIASSDVASLSSIFENFTTVIGCTGMVLPAGAQLKLAHAAIDSGVRRYIPWQFGVDYDLIGRKSGQDLFDEQLDVRALLRSNTRNPNSAAESDGKGIGWVIVSTGMFTSFLFEEVFGVVTGLSRQSENTKARQIRVRALGGLKNRVSVTNVADIGRVVAELALNAPEVQGVIHVCGQTISYEGVAKLLQEVSAGSSTEVVCEEWPMQQLKEELAESPGDGMRKYRVVFGEETGVWWDEGTTWDKGRPGLELEDVRAWMVSNLQL